MAASPLPAFPQPQKSSQVPDTAQLGMGWGGTQPPCSVSKAQQFPQPPADFGQGATSGPGVIWGQSLIPPTFPTVGW